MASLLLTDKAFRLFRTLGVHVTPVHFYSPVPDVRELEHMPGFWERESEMPGVEIEPRSQLRIMEEVFARYKAECDFPRNPTGIPYQYHTENDYFGYVSAAAMHSMVRHFRPKRVIEVGAGNTTYVIANAARLNAQEGHPAEVIAVEPHPSQALRKGFPGLTRLIRKRVQEIDLDLLTSLRANDILSIDSSHAVRTGGDVTFLYLEVLPRLAPGVLVHSHDIFLPRDYPREWLHRRVFWTEQYLLHAFLIYNSAYKVLWGQRYAALRFPLEYEEIFSGRTGRSENYDSYSFWIRRGEPIAPA